MRRLTGLVRDRGGSVLTEYALTLPLFLATLFALVDFGQVYLRWLLAEKATQIAVRTASVRPPVCLGVPEVNTRAAGGSAAFGTSCAAAPGICATPASVICSAAAAGDPAAEIFARVQPLLPADATPADLLFTYQPAGLGFLGGPYVPLVTVELGPAIDVPYITPFGPLLAMFGSGPAQPALAMPPMRATLPAEDLALGSAG